MAGAAVRGRLTWTVAEVISLVEETRRVHSIGLRVPGWIGHRPGQHVDIRLTAEDGYQAQRSYSIATPQAGEEITITVELVEGGEVSSYLIGDLVVGDRFELRGPIGGYFVWDPSMGGPLQLIAGGSGVVPLMAMTRALASAEPSIRARLLVSSRSWDEAIYRDELAEIAQGLPGLELHNTLTRAQPPGWTGYARRVDRPMLEEVTWPPTERPMMFVCGPTGFVEAVATALIDLGHEPGLIKTERFGPTGG